MPAHADLLFSAIISWDFFLYLVMQRLILLILMVCGMLSASAQTETPPTAQEKAEVNKLLNHYSQYRYKMPAEDKAKLLRYYIYSPQIYVYNDLDTLFSPDDIITFQEYDKKISSPGPTFVFGGSFNLETLKLGNVKYDKDRKYYYIDAEVDKDYRGRKLTSATAPDGSTTITNTPFSLPSKTLHFVIVFEKAGSISKNFKVAAISLKGTEPRLPEIKK
jgi:hypothetical protein